MKFWGYQRPDGRVGVRNHVAVIPSTYCAVRVARWIAERVQGAVALHHSVGCSQVGLDLEMTARTLKNLGRHPNVAAVLVVGLGCERLTPAELAEGIAESGKSVEMITIQDCGGSLKALEAGASIARKLVQHAATLKKEQFGLEHLAVATECGGTDGLSGLLANPAVGIAADMLVAEGGTAMISEINELLGTEHLMAARAASSEVADRIRKVVALSEARLAWQSENDRTGKRLALISTGNFDGGVSTVVEKALGGYKKSGASPFVDVLRYSDLPSKRGLHLMDTSGNDAESTTGMVAGGCQVVLFTTGRGTPTGHPIAPVIKVTGNTQSYQKMFDNIDVNTGTVLDGTMTLRQAGEEVFREVLAVADGKLTKAEILGHDELMAVWRSWPEHERAYGCGEWG